LKKSDIMMSENQFMTENLTGLSIQSSDKIQYQISCDYLIWLKF